MLVKIKKINNGPSSYADDELVSRFSLLPRDDDIIKEICSRFILGSEKINKFNKDRLIKQLNDHVYGVKKDGN